MENIIWEANVILNQWILDSKWMCVLNVKGFLDGVTGISPWVRVKFLQGILEVSCSWEWDRQTTWKHEASGHWLSVVRSVYIETCIQVSMCPAFRQKLQMNFLHMCCDVFVYIKQCMKQRKQHSDDVAPVHWTSCYFIGALSPLHPESSREDF